MKEALRIFADGDFPFGVYLPKIVLTNLVQELGEWHRSSLDVGKRYPRSCVSKSKTDALVYSEIHLFEIAEHGVIAGP